MYSLWKEEDELSLQWLDTKEPKSVQYVSFGSVIVIASEQLVLEFAMGLANSNHFFVGYTSVQIWSLATQQSCQLNLKWKLRNVDFLQTDVFKRKYQANHQVVDSQHIVVGVQLWRAYLLDFQRSACHSLQTNK
jgi:hypothetical protein